MATVPQAAETSSTVPQAARARNPVNELQTMQLPALHGRIDEEKASEWKTGLFECGSCIACLMGYFVPCFLTGQTSERMRDPTMATAQALNADCLIHCAGACVHLGFLWVILKRIEIRQQFNIPGSTVEDAVIGYCCSCCATIQQFNEVEARLGPVQTEFARGYQPNEGMVVPPAMARAPPAEQNPVSQETNSAPSAPV